MDRTLFKYPDTAKNTIVILSSRFTRTNRESRLGTMSTADVNIALNQISSSIMELCKIKSRNITPIKTQVQTGITFKQIKNVLKPLVKNNHIKYHEAIDAISDLF